LVTLSFLSKGVASSRYSVRLRPSETDREGKKMGIQTIRSCDDPAHLKAKKCPEGAGAVEERAIIFGKRSYSMDLCNDSYAKGLAVIAAFLKPAEEQKRVILLDTKDYKELAARHWVNLPQNKEKHGYSKGIFGDKRMKAFNDAVSEWENWKPGDDLPEEWEYNRDKDEVIYTGEAKI
jgi:hypothetical protein